MTYWIVNLIGLAGVTCLLVGITKVTKSVLTHAHFFSFVWGATLLIAQVVLDGLIRPDMFTVLVMYAAWWAFLFGSIIPLGNICTVTKQVLIKKPQGIFILLILLALQWAGVLYEIETLGLRENFGNLLSQLITLRLGAEIQTIKLPPFLGTWRWGHTLYIPLAMFLLSNRHISRKFFGLILGFAIFPTVLHFTRAPFTQLVLICLVSWLMIYKPARVLRTIVFGMASLLIVIFFITTQRALVDSYPRDPIPLGESLLSYFGLSPRAFETILVGEFPRENGYYTFDAVYFALNKLSWVSDYPGLSRPYIYDPLVTNLYTFLDTFTLDFGIIGAFIGAGISGFVSSWFYLRARLVPNVFNVVVYGYLLYACIMAPANNEFIRFALFLNAGFAWLINRWVKNPSNPFTVNQVVARPKINNYLPDYK